MNGTSTDEMSRAGRSLTGAVHRSTRSRSLRVSLSSRNKARGETASLTIQLDNPDEMIDKVLQVLSARFPVDTFFNVIAEQPELHWMTANTSTTNSHILLSQALQNPSMVAQILPEELRAQWLAYASSATTHQVQSTASPAVATYAARGDTPGSVYSSSSSRENTAGVAVVQGAYSMHQDTTTSMEANSSTVSMAPQDHVDHLTTASQPQVGAILGAGPSSDPNAFSFVGQSMNSSTAAAAVLDATMTTTTTMTNAAPQHPHDSAMVTTHTVEGYSQMHRGHDVTVALETPLQSTADRQQPIMTSMTEQFHEGMAAATQDNYVGAQQHFTPASIVDATLHMTSASPLPAVTTTTTTTTEYETSTMAVPTVEYETSGQVMASASMTDASAPVASHPTVQSLVDGINYLTSGAATTNETQVGYTQADSVTHVTATAPITSAVTVEREGPSMQSSTVGHSNYSVVDTVNYVTPSAPIGSTMMESSGYNVVDTVNYVTPPVPMTTTTTEYSSASMTMPMVDQPTRIVGESTGYVAPSTSVTASEHVTATVGAPITNTQYTTTTTTTTTTPVVEQTTYAAVDSANYVASTAPVTTTEYRSTTVATPVVEQSNYTVNYVAQAAPVATTTTTTREYTTTTSTPVVETNTYTTGDSMVNVAPAVADNSPSATAHAVVSSTAMQQNPLESYVSQPTFENGQVYYNHHSGVSSHYSNLEAATGLAAVHKTMMPSVSMAVQPSTSPKTGPIDSFAPESAGYTMTSMNSISNMVHQTITENVSEEIVREIRPSPLAPHPEVRRPSGTDSEQQGRDNVERQSSRSSKSSGPAAGGAVVSVQEVQTIGESHVYSNEGKWEEWRDDSADKETEHSAKSGSVSHNDDSSFHETAVEFTESALRRTAEILHSHGCLEQLLMLDASSPIYQQTLHEIASKTDVDLAMINQVFGTSRLQAEFMLWCEAMYRPAPSQRYALQRQALATAHSTTTPAQTMPLVTRDFQVIDNQMIHTLASPIMTVRTTVTVEPGMLQTHTASTTTTLHRNGEEWAKDTRAVGQLTVSTPAEKQYSDTRFAVTEATPLAGPNVVAVAPLNLQTANTQFVMSAAHAEAVTDQASPVSVMSITPTAANETYTQASAVLAHQQMTTNTENQLESVHTPSKHSAQGVPERTGSISERSMGSQRSVPRSQVSGQSGSHHSVPVSHHSVTGSHHSVARSHHSQMTGSHHSVAAVSHHTASHHTASHHTASHHTASHHSASHHSPSHHSVSHHSVSQHSGDKAGSVGGSVSHHSVAQPSHHSGSHPASVAAPSRSDRAGSVSVSQHSQRSITAKSTSVKSLSRNGSGQMEGGIIRQTSHASSRRSGHQVVSSAVMTAGAAAIRTTEVVYSQTNEIGGYSATTTTFDAERTANTTQHEQPAFQPQLTVENMVPNALTSSMVDLGATTSYDQHMSHAMLSQSQPHIQTCVTETRTTTTEVQQMGDYEQRPIVQSPLAPAHVHQTQVLTRAGSPASQHSRASQKEGSRKNTEHSQKSASIKAGSVKSASIKSASVKSGSVQSASVKSSSQKSAAVVSASGSVNARQMSQSSHSATGGVHHIPAAVVPTGAQLAQTANLIAQQVTTGTTITSNSMEGGHAMKVAAADISTQLRQTGVWKMEAPGAIVTGGVRQLSGSSHPSFEMQVDVVEETEGPVTDSPAARMVIEQARGSVTARTATHTTTTTAHGAARIDAGMVTARAVMETAETGERSPVTVTRTVVYPRGQPSANTTVTNVTHNVASWSSVLPQQARDIVYLQSTSPRPDLVGSQTPAGAHTTPAKVMTTVEVNQLAAAAAATAAAAGSTATMATATRVSGLSRQYSQSSSPTAQQQQVTTGWNTASHYQMGRGRGTFISSPIAANIQTQPRTAAVLSSSMLRSTSPLAASIGHDRFFAHASGAATTTHISTTSRGIAGVVEPSQTLPTSQPSTYVAYNEWKSAAMGGETYSSSQQSVSKHTASKSQHTTSKSQHTTSVMSSKYAPPAAMAQINTSSPLAQLKQENPNPLLEKLALHWTR